MPTSSWIEECVRFHKWKDYVYQHILTLVLSALHSPAAPVPSGPSPPPPALSFLAPLPSASGQPPMNLLESQLHMQEKIPKAFKKKSARLS